MPWGFVYFDKITAQLIYFYSYSCFWQIARPPSQMVAETASIINDRRP
jgi:hypothetical protein